MAVLVTDPDLESRVFDERYRCEACNFDEVWEGLTVMAPMPNDVHQEIQLNFGAALKDALGWSSAAKIRAGVNVSDRNEGWTQNYRCPDVVVYLPGNNAINHNTHWQGGPDFLVEILSDGERALEKLPFYAKVGVREAIFIRRDPWALELYVSDATSATMRLDATAAVDGKAEVRSKVLPLSFSLHGSAGRPLIKVSLVGEALLKAGERNCWFV